MEGIPSIEGNDYYTPLAFHSDFINKYISNIPELNQEAQNEFKIVKVGEGVYEDPEQVEAYLNGEAQLANVRAMCDNLREQMSRHDLDLVKAMDWSTVDYGHIPDWDPATDNNLPNSELDESSNED